MDNKAITTLLYETADLLEIDGQDSFRVRSYRNAAEAIEALPQQVADLISEPKKLLAVQGIGKGMLANLRQHVTSVLSHVELHVQPQPVFAPAGAEPEMAMAEEARATGTTGGLFGPPPRPARTGTRSDSPPRCPGSSTAPR